MDIITIIVGGALALLLSIFILRLTYTILHNLIDGHKFHLSLEREFEKLRLSKMLSALGINKTTYIYQNRVGDIQQQMANCRTCTNTEICDEKVANDLLTIDEIAFCNNETRLADIKQKMDIQQTEKH